METNAHYKKMNVEPWDVIDSWPREQRVGFYRGNIIKYAMRIGSKDENLKEALKLLDYAKKLVEILEQKE
jgi:hypothetical protein